MNTQGWLRRITIATSLVGLAIGFLLLGLLILSNPSNDDAPVASGVVGILLGTAFLMLACSYWRHEALKLRRGGEEERFIKQPNVEVRKLFDLVRDDVWSTSKHQQQPFTYGSPPGREDFYFVAGK